MHWTLAPAVSVAVQTKLLLSTVVGRLGSLDPQGGSLVQKSAKKSPMLGLPSPKAAPFSTRGTTGKFTRADGAPTSPAPMALEATKVTLKKLAATSGTVAVVRTCSAVSHWGSARRIHDYAQSDTCARPTAGALTCILCF